MPAVERGSRLLVVYHRPFWRGDDGGLWEREGAFSRYLESLSSHFERILVAVPEAPAPVDSSLTGHRLTASNVTLVPLPFFDGLAAFFRVLPRILTRLWWAIGQADGVNLRMPTPAGVWAYALARQRRRPVSLLIVGDLAGVAESVPTGTLKGRLYRLYVALEERLLQAMVGGSLTITNGHALYEKHARSPLSILETHNSTIRATDIERPREPFEPPRVRLLCVSRVDPRKGLRFLPEAMEVLRENGFEPSLDIIGPLVGRPGEEERAATLTAAHQRGLSPVVHFLGVASIEQVYAAYTSHDLLLVPSLPGEGVPRVLLEAMAAGLPIAASRVAGIPDLIEDGRSGLLAPPADGAALGAAALRLSQDHELRSACVTAGYRTARQHTADSQGAWLAEKMNDHIRAGTQLHARERESTTQPGSPASPVRITIPLAGLNLSGGVKSLCLLANRLAERGEKVRLLAPDYASEPPVALHPEVELRILTAGGKGRGLGRQLRYLLSLSREAAADADVVLANYFLTAYPAFASWLLQGRRAALAYNIRGYEPWSHGLMAPTRLAGRYLRFALAWLSYRLPFTRLVTTDWLKRMVGDRQAIVVGHGIDLEVFTSDGEPRRAVGGSHAPVVGVIGRTGDVKGYPVFLEAVGALPADGAVVRLLVIRADPVRLPVGREVEAIEARTEREMAAFYRRCDIFVFPSLAEGFGLPALEAMACGCAVITTDCGGVAAFARADENCLMVQPGQAGPLARAIARLAADADLRGRLAIAGAQTAQAFNRQAALDRLADTIVKLAPRRSTWA